MYIMIPGGYAMMIHYFLSESIWFENWIGLGSDSLSDCHTHAKV